MKKYCKIEGDCMKNKFFAYRIYYSRVIVFITIRYCHFPIRSIEIRKDLTAEWDRSGVKPGEEYAILTNEISKASADKRIIPNDIRIPLLFFISPFYPLINFILSSVGIFKASMI